MSDKDKQYLLNSIQKTILYFKKTIPLTSINYNIQTIYFYGKE